LKETQELAKKVSRTFSRIDSDYTLDVDEAFKAAWKVKASRLLSLQLI